MRIFPFLFAVGALQAAPIGNPASPALLQEGLFIADTVWCQPRASFIEDFLMQKKLSGSRHYAHVGNVKIKGTSSLGCASWSIRERFDLSFIAGSGSQTLRFSLDDQQYKARFQGGLIWYGEVKLIVIEVKDTTLSGYGEAGGWDWMSGPFQIEGEVVSRHSDLLMRFWTVGATLSQKIGIFNPYAGVAVMRSRWKFDETHSGGFLFHQKYPVGPLVGCSISNTSKFLLNVEWRGWIENAVSVSGEVRF
jgi:hypothetical protein